MLKRERTTEGEGTDPEVQEALAPKTGEAAAGAKALDAAAQKALDDELLRACFEGTVDEVKAVLARGASVLTVNSNRATGLSFACRRQDWDVAEPIVDLLLTKRCPPGLPTCEGCNALHVAATYSSCAVVRLLLDTDPRLVESLVINTKTPNSHLASALVLCCGLHASPSDSLRIAKLLLDRGIDPNAVSATGKSALMFAAARGGPELVKLLLARGARVDVGSRSPLHLACQNGAFGREMIPMLCRAGADPAAPDGEGRTPFFHASQHGAVFLEALAPFLPRGFRHTQWTASINDPVGSWTWCARYGADTQAGLFAEAVSKRLPFPFSWAALRLAVPPVLDNSERDYFRVLQGNSSVDLWKWASSEPLMQQHPLTGDTVFHLLCRSNALTGEQKLAVLADLEEHCRNPFVPNFHNQLCIQLTKDPELCEELLAYMQWRPERRVTQWFGPRFAVRARTLLLVCERFRTMFPKQLGGINAEIRHHLVRHLSRTEHLYVPVKRWSGLRTLVIDVE